MDFIWTPWRYRYVASAHDAEECVFCRVAQEDADRENLILVRKQHAYVILNRFPYTSGHHMVVALRHVASLDQARSAELSQMILLARDCERALHEVYRPDGFNVGFNLGKSAGAGVAGHLHLHVVPRWQGDASFVSVLSETRLIPEELATTYEKLRARI